MANLQDIEGTEKFHHGVEISDEYFHSGNCPCMLHQTLKLAGRCT